MVMQLDNEIIIKRGYCHIQPKAYIDITHPRFKSFAAGLLHFVCFIDYLGGGGNRHHGRWFVVSDCVISAVRPYTMAVFPFPVHFTDDQENDSYHHPADAKNDPQNYHRYHSHLASENKHKNMKSHYYHRTQSHHSILDLCIDDDVDSRFSLSWPTISSSVHTVHESDGFVLILHIFPRRKSWNRIV